MGLFSVHTPLRASLPAIILWGCFCGICLTAACYYLQKAEQIIFISCYSYIVSPLYPFWKFGTIILLSFTLGMVTADLFCIGRKTGRDPIRTGLVSGACITLVTIILVEIYPLSFTLGSHPMFLVETLIYILVAYILITTLPQVLGAWYQGSRMISGQGPDEPAPPAQAGRKYRHWFFFVILLVLLLILPVGLLALPVDTTDYFACPEGTTCMPGHQCGMGMPPDNVTVSRASPDSIRLSLKAGSLTCGSQNSFKILLNGYDVNNQALIAKSGLNVTISPREGLGRQDGAFVILQGRDVVANETAPPHIQVIMTDRSGASVIHRDLYL
jgi:hypothetical protein